MGDRQRTAQRAAPLADVAQAAPTCRRHGPVTRQRARHRSPLLIDCRNLVPYFKLGQPFTIRRNGRETSGFTLNFLKGLSWTQPKSTSTLVSLTPLPYSLGRTARLSSMTWRRPIQVAQSSRSRTVTSPAAPLATAPATSSSRPSRRVACTSSTTASLTSPRRTMAASYVLARFSSATRKARLSAFSASTMTSRLSPPPRTPSPH